MSTDHIEHLVPGTEAEVQTLNDNFDYLDDRCTAINGLYTTLNTQVSDLNTSVSNMSAGLNIIDLGTNGTRTLTDNRVHKITVSGSTTLKPVDPVSSARVKFHQMLVLVDMTTVAQVTLGTSHFFNKSAPVMNKTGQYTLLYEFDATRNWWVCGGIAK